MAKLAGFVALAVLCGSLAVAAQKKRPLSPPLPTITVCGTLVEGVECVLLETGNGGLYIVNTAGFPVGACICVTGPRNAFCLSYCQQGGGYTYNTTATPCD